MSNNKSESVTSRPSQLKHMHTLSNKDKISKQDPRSNDKPSIDIHIAKGLDTLDREGIKNLKKSLMATRNLEDLHNYVEEEIACDSEEVSEHPSGRKQKGQIGDEIKEEIVEYQEQDSPTKQKNVEEQRRITYEHGKFKTFIKPRPISAIQKQEVPVNRSSQVIKKSFDSPSSTSRELMNPFKSQKKKEQTPAQLRQQSKISNLLKRIKHLENSQIEQLEIILEKIERGEIESVEGSNDIIKMGVVEQSQRSESREKENIEEEFYPHPQQITTDNFTLNKLTDIVDSESKVLESETKVRSSTLELETKEEYTRKPESKVIKESLVMPVPSFQHALSKEVKLVVRKNHTLAIKILGNWGHPKIIGLTRLELFSKSGEPIEVLESQVKNCSKRMMKLFTGTPFTTNENEMWISPCPEPPAVIVVELSLNTPVGALRVWNYNKSQIQSNKGTKTVKIIMNDEKWNGDIKKGCGNDREDYSTLIKINLNPGANLPPVEIPLLNNPLQSMSMPFVSKQDPINSNKWLEETLVKKQLVELMEEKKPEVAQNKIQRSGSYEGRKKGSKSTMTHRIEPKEEIKQQSHEDPSDHRRNLQIQAQAVRKNVAESIQIINKNLQFDVEDIFSQMGNTNNLRGDMHRNKIPPTHKRSEDNLHDRSSYSSTNQVKSIITSNIPTSDKDYVSSNVHIQNQVKVSPRDNQEDIGQLVKELNDLIPSKSPTRIPQLPKGLKLVFILRSNWGDPVYVGVNKIEIFNSLGSIIQLGLGQISGNCSHNPISNIVNQNSKVTDKTNIWMSELKKSNKISIDLQVETAISMIRVWNYNESRIHTMRGIRGMSVELDGLKIFQGEISKSTGELSVDNCEYLLFTSNEKIIGEIAEKDWVSKQSRNEWESLEGSIQNLPRPSTTQIQKEQTQLRPNRQYCPPANLKRLINAYETPVFPVGKELKLIILSSWGDRHYVGLNHLQIFSDTKSNILKKYLLKLKANPSSVSILPGMEKDLRTIDKVLDPSSSTMWLSPLNSEMDKVDNQFNSITLIFDSPQIIGMINFHNYAKTPSRGVREIHILLDGVIIYQGYVANGGQKEFSSVGFTKDVDYLKGMEYQGYDESGQEQNVALVDEKRDVRKVVVEYGELERPFTSLVNGA